MKTAVKPLRYATFINGDYSGYCTSEELQTLEDQARRAAKETRKSDDSENVFAYVYAYYSYTKDDILEAAHFYSGYPKTENEYDDLSTIPRIVIRSIFRR